MLTGEVYWLFSVVTVKGPALKRGWPLSYLLCLLERTAIWNWGGLSWEQAPGEDGKNFGIQAHQEPVCRLTQARCLGTILGVPGAVSEGGGKSKRARKNFGRRTLLLDFSSLEFFPRPLRLFPAPTNCPWVSEDAWDLNRRGLWTRINPSTISRSNQYGG